MRPLCLLALGCLAGLVVYTYDLKLKTRALEAKATELASRLQDENDFVALMRAEVSFLNRPERIAELARTKLGFEPVSPVQIVPWNSAVPQPVETASAWQTRTSPAPRDGIAALIERTKPAVR
jgi:hypothetical protein